MKEAMKKFAVLVLAAAALAFPAAQANAASPATPTIAQFKGLQKQVKTPQSKMKKLQTQAKDLNGSPTDLSRCSRARTSSSPTRSRARGT
jgi:hypothetical protein